MGNRPTSESNPAELPAPAAADANNEPLEAFMREKQRDDHLKNLGFKRSKSLRRSLAKRIRRARGNHDTADGKNKHESGTESNNPDLVDRGKGVPRQSRMLVGETQPMPTHVQEFEDGRLTGKRMDKLRRSLRSSLRRKRERDSADEASCSTGKTGGGNGKPQSWSADEAAVKSGTCSFHVKYLGCVEVFESRGMQVCEEAVRVLKNSRQKSVRAILYVHGDGLRVVDDNTKGLIVDQTIEKVSFCAPDRNYDRGFSYICRDGTTRRWMCHGFMAIKELGERLSHAVGCAFAICLEKKQQRDKLCAVSMSVDTSNSSFTRIGSFRQSTMTERFIDPQIAKPCLNNIPVVPEENPFAVSRPHATDLMLARQTSFKGLAQLGQNSPFKRQLSLRLNDLPSNLERTRDKAPIRSSSNVDNESGGGQASSLEVLKQNLSLLYKMSEDDPQPSLISESKFESISEEDENETKDEAQTSDNTIQDPISSMCQQVSAELNQLSLETPTLRSEEEDPRNEENCPPDPIAVSPMRFDNPWDFVPDQPNNNKVKLEQSTNNNCGDSSSSGVSCGSGNNNAASSLIQEEETEASKLHFLDDPFDAEWAALAARESNKPTNPFNAFELQL